MTPKNRKLAKQVTQQINRQLERDLKGDLSRFFRILMNKTLDAFDEYYNDTLLLQGQVELILSPIHESHQAYYNLLWSAVSEMFNRGMAHGERQIPKSALKAAKPVRFQHDGEDKYTKHFGTLPFTEDHLRDYTFTATEHTMNRVDKDINQILLDGYKEGWGVKDVRNRIIKRYEQLQGWEAQRIARTEMQTAHNMGVMNSYQELGVEYKEWRSAHDKRVRGNRKSDRANHIIMDGEIARLDQPFSNGLMYPGDKTGRIEEWINCRCSVMPYLMKPGTIAPTGQTTFRDHEVVSVNEPNYDQLLKKHTGGAIGWEEYQQLLQGKTLEQLGISITTAQTLQEPTDDELKSNLTKEELEQVEWAKSVLSKDFHTPKMKQKAQSTLDELYAKAKGKQTPKVADKQPAASKEPKVIKEPKPKIDVDLDKIMQDALRGAGVSTKPKKKTKPKPAPKPKKKEVRDISLEQHLRNELPNEICDEAITYIVDRVKKRGTVKTEYGQIFDYRTGKTQSPEFRGGKGSVHIKTEDWIKPKKEFTMEELIDALSNPQKYKKSYISNSNSLASQHNHPPDGCRAPSGADFYANLISEWEDFGFQISKEEVWCIEYKGKMNMIDAKDVEKGCNRAFKKAKRQAEKEVMRDYDHLKPKEKSELKAELTKDYYADNLVDFIDGNEHGIKLHRVIL